MDKHIIKDRIEKGEGFLNLCIRDGLAHSYDVIENKWVKPYPEVTGYLLSYFSNNPNGKILSAADKLIEIQNSNGGFMSFSDSNRLYTFDTAQILHGFLSLYQHNQNNKYLEVSTKCFSFIESMVDDGFVYCIWDVPSNKRIDVGGGFYSNDSRYSIQSKIVESLLQYYEVLKVEKAKMLALEICNFCKSHNYNTLTHPFGYYLEGMYAMKEFELVKQILKDEVVPRIENDGFISYSKDLSYAYVSGSIQLAILMYKLGLCDYAIKIYEWVGRVQDNHVSGGIFQYANKDASLNRDVHTEINSWGTKYYCELGKLLND